MPMKIVVTGGAGFIGSNFIRYMRSAHPEHKILCLDKLTYAGSLDNLTGILGSPDFMFSKTDIADEKAVNEALKSFMPDVIVNFAAESHVDRSIADARDFVRTNVEGVRVLLEAARITGARFHQISTDEVYGDLPVRSTEKFTETSALRPSSPYSATKAAADLLALSYHRTYGLFVTVSRSSNNYGMHQYPEKLIPLAVKNILCGKPVPVYGDGGNVRDWIAVEDHSEAVYTVLERGRSGEVYNVGGGNERTNLEIVDGIIEILGEGSREFVRDRAGHDRRYALDTAKIYAEFGWKPKVPFEEGLIRTVQGYAKKG